MKILWCWITGHSFCLTGRKTIALYQIHCVDCNRFFIGNLDDPGTLLPWDIEWEAYFQSRKV